ncbi:MAG: leucine-rich repeat domain-containing protein [Bacillota bacterium]|nr:leucine-rich repeat domain-containing protein [Bacillota bacterium]
MKRILLSIVAIFILVSLFPVNIARAATVISFPDSNLANALSLIIGKPSNAITDDDMRSLTGSLALGEKNIVDLTGIQYATNITRLELYSNKITNITPLASLTKLTELEIGGNPINDLSPLGNLVNLNYLVLPTNREFTNYSAMASLTKLQTIYAPLDNISDLSFMNNLKELKRIDLPHNGITDITPLTGLTKLEDVDLSDNDISNVKPLLGSLDMRNLSLGANHKLNDDNLKDLKVLTKLTQLHVGNTNISDLSPIDSMTNLQMLNVQGSQVKDISVLSNLHNLQSIYLQGNYITDVSPLAGLTHLQDQQVDLRDNFINTFSGDNKTILDELNVKSYVNEQNKIALDPNGKQSFTVNTGETINIPIYVLQSNDGVSWTLWNGIPGEDIGVQSSDKSIATSGVTVGGVPYVTGVSAGTVEITATYKGINSEFTTTKFSVKVNAPQLKGSITVRYKDEDNNDISTPDVINNLDLGNYTENAKTISGFFLDDSTSKSITLTADNLNQTVIFTYKKILGSITVKYQDESGVDIITPDITNKLSMGTYTRSAKSIQGYTLNDSSTKSVYLTDNSPNKTIIFIYKKDIVQPPVIKGSYTVQYKDHEGNLLDQEVKSFLDLGTYTIQSKSFDGYTLDDSFTKTVTLTECTPNQTIVFYYKKNEILNPTIKGSIIVKYQDENGVDIQAPLVDNNLELGSYVEFAKSINGYVLKDNSMKIVNLSQDNKDQTVIFSYKKIILGTIIVQYKDQDGNLIAPEEVKGNLKLMAYAEQSKNFPGYTLNDIPMKTVVLNEEQPSKTIVFNYKKVTGTVEGTVTDVNGKPIKGIRIELHSNPIYTLTDENGHYKFTNVELGNHVIRISDVNYKSIKEIRISVSIDENNKPTTKVIDGNGTPSQDLSLTQDSNRRIVDFVVVPTGEIVADKQKNKLPQTGSTIDFRVLISIGLALILIGSIVFSKKIIKHEKRQR